ncbi:hypothetical protein E2C01_027058 [Portunus trituberculatus]|uniref:Uncharacterized protein n=1 Tax=Portunus trituberculatus TaxID=210409 RepID=A0A5B7EKM8_PORTR|nr:hypothetical protein [Portunus trituberculatus]
MFDYGSLFRWLCPDEFIALTSHSPPNSHSELPLKTLPTPLHSPHTGPLYRSPLSHAPGTLHTSAHPQKHSFTLLLNSISHSSSTCDTNTQLRLPPPPPPCILPTAAAFPHYSHCSRRRHPHSCPEDEKTW